MGLYNTLGAGCLVLEWGRGWVEGGCFVILLIEVADLL